MTPDFGAEHKTPRQDDPERIVSCEKPFATTDEDIIWLASEFPSSGVQECLVGGERQGCCCSYIRRG